MREKLKDYSGLSQEIINFLINNSGLDRKILFYEIEKIKSLFLDKKIKFDKLLEVSNNANNLDFNNLRDACFGAEKRNLNKNLGNVVLQNEEGYLYLSILNNRIEKLSLLNQEYNNEKNIEKAINNLKPPIFWKDKPSFQKQIKNWDLKKLNEAKKMLFDTEFLMKSNIHSNNTLIKKLVINLFNMAASTS